MGGAPTSQALFRFRVTSGVYVEQRVINFALAQSATVRSLAVYAARDDRFIRRHFRSMKIMRCASNQLLVREWFDLLRFDQHDIVGILDDPFDDEKRLFRNQKPHALK
jgi:hypothetical protein